MLSLISTSMDGTVGDIDQVRGSSHISKIFEKVQEAKGEFVLLLAIGIVGLIAYVQARPLMEQSPQVPLLIVCLMGLVWVLTLVTKLYGDEIRAKIGLSEAATGFDLASEDDSADMMSDQIFDLQPRGVVKHFLWVIIYTLGLVYVGFWTTNIVFPLIYIMAYETSPPPRRFVYFALWTALIVGVLWILFVELLLVQSIWRLGFLP
jgi:hypothetical protein